MRTEEKEKRFLKGMKKAAAYCKAHEREFFESQVLMRQMMTESMEKLYSEVKKKILTEIALDYASK